MLTKKNKFPSPYGDYGSYLHFQVVEKDGKYIMFPSPYGDYGSYLVVIKEVSRGKYLRFRPLTGIMVLIDKYIYRIGNEVVGVSVPLRGLWFLSDPIA